MNLFVIFILIFMLWLFNESFINTEYILPKQIYCYWHDLSNNRVITPFLLENGTVKLV